MQLRSIILSFLLFTGLHLLAQNDTTFRLTHVLPGNFIDFTVDNLGNVYLLNANGQLKKLGPQGDSIGVYNDVRRYGKIALIDASNPLKVLLYFRDYGTIVVLDRFLNNRSVIDLRKQNLFQVKAIAQSYDNNVWVFDELESKLKRIAEDGRIIDQSTDLRQVFDSTPSPSFIADQNKQVYLYDTTLGVFIFDYYGAFKNRIRLTGWTDFTVIGHALYGRDAGMLYKYEPGTLDLQQYPIPATMRNARKIKIAQGIIYVMNEKGLEVYSYR